jgi:hypothetical protein
MKACPSSVGGGKVVRWSAIDARHRATGACRHILPSGIAPPAAGLAICENVDGMSFYLFGCNSDWVPITDTWHETLEKALRQAESEYEGVSLTWSVGE